jgi:hypothetical protein
MLAAVAEADVASTTAASRIIGHTSPFIRLLDKLIFSHG